MKTSNAKFFNKLAFVATVALVTGTGISAQAAGTQSATMSLSTEVVANCTISADTLTVSGYDPIVAHKTAHFDQESNVNVTCTNGSPVTITLNNGQNDGRQLKFGTDGTDKYLDYELYSDSARTVVWGNTNTGVKTTGTGLAEALTVYMRVTAGQNVPAGTYTDVVTAVVTF